MMRKYKKAVRQYTQDEISEFARLAEISRRFTSDTAHAEFKKMIEKLIEIKRDIYDNLGDTAETNDEYLRRSLVLSTEIKTLRFVLNEPQRLIDIDTNITKRKIPNEKSGAED